MTAISWTGVAALLFATAAAGQVPSDTDWDRADAETVRLAPEKINELPLPIRQQLTQLGCTIPQEFGATKPGNFVAGQFLSPGRTDIAVLCSRDRTSSILVFSNGSTKPVAELAPASDRDFLQVVVPGQIGFSRSIGVAHPQAIRSYHAAYGGLEPPPALDHDGIENIHTEKASTIWYWHEGQWLQLTGSD